MVLYKGKIIKENIMSEVLNNVKLEKLNYLKISNEVANAIKNNIPVVALESTIISHGMPYPQNMETALECENIIRNNGAVPATIAIIKGVMCVGLSKDEIEYIAKEGKNVYKTSRRDLPLVISKHLNGATTVATTMYIASLAGIKVFATGGIGGVHRGAEISMDISADLEELAMTDVAVVCAGAKAILDLEKTLEYLETKGVPVIGYQTNKLPAFYTRTSKYNVNYRLDSPKEIADMLNAKWAIGLKGGVLITNPIPEEYSMPEDKINKAIDEAIIRMNREGIKGKDQTPYLLKTIVELTEGKSLEANIKLVFNNCALASQIAKEYCNNDKK
jgi:pseudouridine-5'-phosphate glycosidase